MKKLVSVFFLLLILICPSFINLQKEYYPNKLNSVYAEEVQNSNTFKILNEKGEVISEANKVFLGDRIITKDFDIYEILRIDEKKFIAYTKYIASYKKPKIKNILPPSTYSLKKDEKIKGKIGLYMTHNDESYEIGDNTSSIYGKGGIHDISKALKKELEKDNIYVVLDETVHAPHDYNAYSKSRITATNLLNKKVDAIFDIHRDAGGRNTYLFNDNGINKSKIRIVIGKSNSNNAKNLDFALFLLSVAKELNMDDLFLDIYYGRGHYNQNLSNKALLFECGTHTIEKEYVLNSMQDLGKIVSTTLYNTYINESTGELIIGSKEEENQPNKNETIPENEENSPEINLENKENVNEFLEENKENKNRDNTILSITIILIVSLIAFFIYKIYVTEKENERLNINKTNEENTPKK